MRLQKKRWPPWCEELSRHAEFPCCPGPRPTVMTQRPPPALPRHQQPIRAPEPTVWHRGRSTDSSMTSPLPHKQADLFSSVWNPAFVKRRAAPAGVTAGCVYSERRPNSDSQFSALCMLAAAAAICGDAWGLGSRGGCWEQKQRESGLCGPPAGWHQAPRREQEGPRSDRVPRRPNVDYREEGREREQRCAESCDPTWTRTNSYNHWSFRPKQSRRHRTTNKN